uniref:Uncharacterized protein n=1 Tax=Culex tarsalis TaxID=7177 RepID=A0A1Q3G2Z0_CULTA
MAKATAVRVSTGKKFSQLLIITPAVAIDNNNDGGYNGPFTAHDSGCGSSGSDASLEQCDDGGSNERITSDRRNNNAKSNRSKLLPKVRQQIVTKVTTASSSTGCGGGGNPAQSWRWCSIICSAVRCFRAATNSQPPFGTIHYSSSGVTTSNGQTVSGSGSVNGRSVRAGSAQATTRFSTNHIYEYTIKSYRADSNAHDHINNNSSASGSRAGSDANDRNVMYKL